MGLFVTGLWVGCIAWGGFGYLVFSVFDGFAAGLFLRFAFMVILRG